MAKQSFGGTWTEVKLDVLEKYIRGYLTIFHNNRSARYFRTVYVDAFAGTGYIERRARADDGLISLFDQSDDEAKEFAKGSVRRILEIQPGFDQYLLIEKSLGRCQELEKLRLEYPTEADKLRIENADANSFLRSWLPQQDWKRRRALIFLDPFGMQVDWSLLESIAKTEAVDLWLLFPLGIGVTRMLTRNRQPPKRWADSLTRVLGTEEWRQFYRLQTKTSLFGDDVQEQILTVTFDDLARFVVSRLKEIFPGVVENPVTLRNSKNSPMYLLCFATANPRQATQNRPAIKIARDVLKKVT